MNDTPEVLWICRGIFVELLALIVKRKEFNGIIEKTNSRKWVAEKSYDTKESERQKKYRICENKEKISFKIKNNFKIKNQCCAQKNICREIREKQQSPTEKSENAFNLYCPDGRSKYRMLVWNKLYAGERKKRTGGTSGAGKFRKRS